MSRNRGKRSPRAAELREKAQLPPETNGASETRPSAVGANWLTTGAVALLAVLLWAYWPTLEAMVGQWLNQPDYSHGFLVLPLALFFLWSRRNRFPYGDVRPSIHGAALLLFACLLRIAAGAFYLTPLDGWTIPLSVAGTVWL